MQANPEHLGEEGEVDDSTALQQRDEQKRHGVQAQSRAQGEAKDDVQQHDNQCDFERRRFA